MVWACSLCFSDELLERVVTLSALHLRPGAMLVTLRLPTAHGADAAHAWNVAAVSAMAEHFEDSHSIGPYKMSWGSAVAHCLVKKGAGAGAGAGSSLPPPPPPPSAAVAATAATTATARRAPVPPLPAVVAASDEFLYELD